MFDCCPTVFKGRLAVFEIGHSRDLVGNLVSACFLSKLAAYAIPELRVLLDLLLYFVLSSLQRGKISVKPIDDSSNFLIKPAMTLARHLPRSSKSADIRVPHGKRILCYFIKFEHHLDFGFLYLCKSI